MISMLILLTLLALHPDIWIIFLNINNANFDNMVSQIYPSLLQLNKANNYKNPSWAWGWDRKSVPSANLTMANDDREGWIFLSNPQHE